MPHARALFQHLIAIIMFIAFTFVVGVEKAKRHIEIVDGEVNKKLKWFTSFKTSLPKTAPHIIAETK